MKQPAKTSIPTHWVHFETWRNLPNTVVEEQSESLIALQPPGNYQWQDAIYSQYPEWSVRTRTQHFLQSLGNTGRGKSPFCMWQTAVEVHHHTTLEMPINVKTARHCLATEQKAIGYPPKLCETDLFLHTKCVILSSKIPFTSSHFPETKHDWNSSLNSPVNKLLNTASLLLIRHL